MRGRRDCWTLPDTHEDFLLDRFPRHDSNDDVVHQELKTELGIDISARSCRERTVQRALKPYRDQLQAARLATPRFETKPDEQLQIDFGVKTVAIEGRDQAVHMFVATLGHSRRIFSKTYAEETQGASPDGTEAAFAYLGRASTTAANSLRRNNDRLSVRTTDRSSDGRFHMARFMHRQDRIDLRFAQHACSHPLLP